jgi:CMP-N,N'-diacetyllegionaminic acid synthase
VSTVAIITARGGSRGLPGKNIALLGGRPLLVWTIEAAQAASSVDYVVVTTDDAEIRAVSENAGAEVIERPLELAGDRARSEDAVRHALDQLAGQGISPERLVLLQPTSPLRTAAHIDDALALLVEGVGSVVSVCEAEHHPHKALTELDGVLQAFGDPALLSAPRQALPRALRQNGAIYAVAVEDFRASGRLTHEPMRAFLMDRRTSVDIDDAFDLRVAEALLGA